MSRLRYIILGVLALLTMHGCKPRTPSQYIQPGKMEDILVDYHIGRAMAQQSDSMEFNTELFLEAVLQKHGVTRADFDSSMVYYYTRADRFDKMYKRIVERLEDKALALGATEGEIGKYSNFNTEGDTANIWAERSAFTLMPMPTHNRFDFTVQVDSTFQLGDSFLLQFMSDFVYQDGLKDGILYVVTNYADTATVSQYRITYSGLAQMRIATSDTMAVTGMHGFFYLGGGTETTSTLRLLFINNIQLIRFHKQHAEPKETNSISPADSSQRPEPDTMGNRDTTGKGDQLLPVVGRNATYRVVERLDSVRRKL